MKRIFPPDDSQPLAGINPHSDTRRTSPELIRSQDLFGGRRELLIEHAGSLYRLRITQNDKLILTK